MIWYIAEMDRFRSEQASVHELEREASDWLVGLDWAMDSSARLLYRFALRISGESIPLTLRYGHSFPSTPPTIFPDPPQRLSGHQYGNGDLCLEYGPDTWVPDCTGADLVRSAYSLLSGEAPALGSPTAEVASRHELTPGQVARNEAVRFVLTGPLQTFLERAPRGVVARARFRLLCGAVAGVFFLVSADRSGEEPWSDPELPPALRTKHMQDHGALVTIASGIDVPPIADRTALDEFLSVQGLAMPASEIDTVLVHGDAETRLLWFHEGKTISVLTIRATDGERLPPTHAPLRSRKVGIVGCGSLGSKIAVMLARAGIDSFVLVDDDVLLPENLVRNDLAWSDVGQHKVEAVAQRIELVAPGAKSIIRKQRIGGQESNSVADSTIGFLKDCDLIIDATAEPTVFNVLSGAATSSSKSLVWAEVFSGGFGGLIARSRPGVDPPPQSMRAGIKAYCDAQGIPAPRALPGYGAEVEGSPWLADDADVTTIAAHAARFAIDVLLARTPSAFPYSCYLIGLAKAWIFQAPFDTVPVDLSEPPLSPPPSADKDPETIATILALFSNRNAEPRPTS